MTHELRPIREAGFTRDHELRVGENGALVRRGEPRNDRAKSFARDGVARTKGTQQFLRLFPELRYRRTRREPRGWVRHVISSHERPCPHAGQKEDRDVDVRRSIRWARPFPRT